MTYAQPSTPITPAPLDHILAPLDGSALAETVLAAARAIALHTGARVTLLHVLERDAPDTVHGERHLSSAPEAEAYLAGIAPRLADAGVTVEWHVHPNPEGDVAKSIAEHAGELAASLIVLCWHGEGGARGWLTGALAQQVIRRTATPVLLLRPGSHTDTPRFAPATVLVALDGTAEGETALPPAMTLANAFNTRLHLVMVTPTVNTQTGDRAAAAVFIPNAAAAALDMEATDNATYLNALARRLTGVHTEVVLHVKRGDPARVIADAAVAASPVVLAMATHGRAGFDALWSGSIGSRVVQRAGEPLLLIHPARRA